jgi:hypothetical protein
MAAIGGPCGYMRSYSQVVPMLHQKKFSSKPHEYFAPACGGGGVAAAAAGACKGFLPRSDFVGKGSLKPGHGVVPSQSWSKQLSSAVNEGTNGGSKRMCRVLATVQRVEEASSPLTLEDLGLVSSSVGDKDKGNTNNNKKKKDTNKSGASSVSSGVRLEHISKTYKGATILKDVNWEVKKGERVGLVGVNGAGKTTQLRIIAGKEEADSGSVVKARDNMKIAFLSQEFEVVGSRTLWEEFMSVYSEQMAISASMEKVQVLFLTVLPSPLLQ